MSHPRLFLPLFAITVSAAACHRDSDSETWRRSILSGPLISSRTTMVTAWEIPKNPLTDPTLDDSKLSKDIRWGFRIFTNTPTEVPHLAPGKVSCANCHLNAGQRERSLPLVGVAGMFPEYNRRSRRLISLGDRIVDCFLRSENATGALARNDAEHVALRLKRTEPPGIRRTQALPRRRRRKSSRCPPISPGSRRATRSAESVLARAERDRARQVGPVAALDSAEGETVFMERCTSCHGADGQGVADRRQESGPAVGTRLVE